MKRTFLALIAVTLPLGLGAASVVLAADPPSTAAAPATPTVGTGAFVTSVAVSNLFEIESSKLAATKAGSEKVKAFAAQMVTDHGQAATKFKQALTDAKLTPPADKLDARHQSIVDDLAKREATGFDQAYIKAQHDAHVEAVALFEAYAKGGDNPRMKQFATEMLPTLKSHLQHVTAMQ